MELRTNASGSLWGESEGRQGIEAEQDHQEGLKRMDYQHEQDCIVLRNGIEHQHTLDSKMPGACAVGRRYQHGKVPTTKATRAAARPKHEVEAKQKKVR